MCAEKVFVVAIFCSQQRLKTALRFETCVSPLNKGHASMPQPTWIQQGTAHRGTSCRNASWRHAPWCRQRHDGQTEADLRDPSSAERLKREETKQDWQSKLHNWEWHAHEGLKSQRTFNESIQIKHILYTCDSENLECIVFVCPRQCVDCWHAIVGVLSGCLKMKASEHVLNGVNQNSVTKLLSLINAQSVTMT